MEKKELGPPLNYDNLRQSLHDLAQPLATVTGLVDLLLLELDEQDKMFEEVHLISEQLEKILAIIEEIRQLVREAAACEKKSPDPPQSPPS
jgi:signal transduction histidine kinase